MNISKLDYDAFAKDYKKEEQEILVLFSDASGGAGKSGETFWSASAYFLAYQDVNTGEIKTGDGRVTWPITDDDLKEHSSSYPYFFKRGAIYRLRVRDLIDRTVPEGRLPSFYNRFLVVEVLEENAQSEGLTTVLEEYRKPVVLQDKVLGSFTMNKDFRNFEGTIDWLGNSISVYMDIDINDENSWAKALAHLSTLYTQQKEKDSQFRQFAAHKLTENANDWLEEEDAPEITEADFANRISLSELSISYEGGYSAYYSDDDMFYGHCITVYGNMITGIGGANIEG